MIGEDVFFASVRDLGAMLRGAPVLRGRAGGGLPATARDDRPQARRGGDGDPRAGARPGAPREPGAARGQGPRSPSRDPVRGQGPAGHEGHPHDLGRRAATASQVFDYDATVVERLREAGAVLVGQARHGRAGGRHGLQQPRRQLHRTGPHALEPRLLERRLLERLGGGDRRGARGLRDRLRDLGLDPHARDLLRPVRAAAHLRPRLPPRRDGAVLDARQARPDVPQPPTTAGSCSPRSRVPTRATPRAGASSAIGSAAPWPSSPPSAPSGSG